MATTTRTPCSWLTLLLFGLFLMSVIASIPEVEGPGLPAARDAQHVPSQVDILRAFEEEAAASPLLGVISSAFTLIVALGAAIDLRFVWRRIKMGPMQQPGGRSAAGWELGDVAKAIVVFLMVFFSLESLYPYLNRCLGGPSDVSLVVIVQFTAELAAICFLLRCVSPQWRSSLGELGLGGGSVLRHIATGVTAYVGFLPILLLLTWVTEEAARRAGIGLEPQEQIGFFFADLSPPALTFLAVFVAVAGPVFEEIFFRGFAYRALRRKWRRWPSVLITALLFSLLHASVSAFLPILGLGVLLACLFEASGSLVPSIVVHVCQNGVAVAGALLVRSLSGTFQGF